MNDIIKYNGNPEDPFSIDLIEKVEVRSIHNKEVFGKVEHWGDHDAGNKQDSYEFGYIVESDIHIEVYHNRIVFRPVIDWSAIWRPDRNTFDMSGAALHYHGRESAYKISPANAYLLPRTMGDFMFVIGVYISAIYKEAAIARYNNLKRAYEIYNKPPINKERDPDLPF